jgi:hypothetical protein
VNTDSSRRAGNQPKESKRLIETTNVVPEGNRLYHNLLRVVVGMPQQVHEEKMLKESVRTWKDIFRRITADLQLEARFVSAKKLSSCRGVGNDQLEAGHVGRFTQGQASGRTGTLDLLVANRG